MDAIEAVRIVQQWANVGHPGYCDQRCKDSGLCWLIDLCDDVLKEEVKWTDKH